MEIEDRMINLDTRLVKRDVPLMCAPKVHKTNQKHQVSLPTELRSIYKTRQEAKRNQDCILAIEYVSQPAGDFLGIITDVFVEGRYDKYNPLKIDNSGRILLSMAPANDELTFIPKGNYVEVWMGDHTKP